MLSFYRLYEVISNENKKVDVPFNIGDKKYILRFFGRPTHTMFPYGKYYYGHIYEVVFFPIEREGLDREEKFARTGDNSFTMVRALLNTFPNLVVQWVQENKPTGYYWHGNDPKLEAVWTRLAPKMIAPGYIRSKTKPHILVQTQLQPLLDEIVYE